MQRMIHIAIQSETLLAGNVENCYKDKNLNKKKLMRVRYLLM